MLWNHFVKISSTIDTKDKTGLQPDDDNKLPSHALDTPLLSSTPTAVLRYFIQSILINVQLSMSQGSLFTNRLCNAGPLRPSQIVRLELVSRLFVAVKVASFINDSSLCLQSVVLCLGLVGPLVQHSVTAVPLLETLLYCHAVLTELPEHVLISWKDSGCTASLHHLIAATAYYVGKVTELMHYETVSVCLFDVWMVGCAGSSTLLHTCKNVHVCMHACTCTCVHCTCTQSYFVASIHIVIMC